MNTGVGDAANLAWKIAEVVRGRASATLLDSYEPERIRFARRLVATTDRAFTVATRRSALARWVRVGVVPRVAPALASRGGFRGFASDVPQIMVEYRKGPLAEGKAGNICGGDRLPWVEPTSTGGADNFTPLASRAWQVHLHGEAPNDLRNGANLSGSLEPSLGARRHRQRATSRMRRTWFAPTATLRSRTQMPVRMRWVPMRAGATAPALAATSWRRQGKHHPGKKMAAGETALHMMPFRRLHLGLSSQRSLSATTRVNVASTPGECFCGKGATRLLSWWTTLADGCLPHNRHKPRLAGYELGGSDQDRRYRRNRPDRLEGRFHSAPARPRGHRRLTQYRRQQHYRRGPQRGHGRHAGGDRPRQFALV